MITLESIRRLKPHIPLIYLVIITVFWSVYYRGSHFLNDYGQAKHEWLFLIDGLVVLPVLCWLCVSDKKAAILKAAVFVSLAVLVGSFIIPHESKIIWPYFEYGRYGLLLLLLLFELSVVITVYGAIRAGMRQGIDPDQAITAPISSWVGQGLLGQLMCFEARMWSFLLMHKRIKQSHYTGDLHFSYHNKDGACSMSLGFMLLMILEIPIVHVLLYFIWSPYAANVITILTLLGLFYMLAEYRAMQLRPISLSTQHVIIRLGLFNTCEINYNDICSITLNHGYVARDKGIKRYNLSGHPNIKIKMHSGNAISAFYLGVDQPNDLLKHLTSRLIEK
ncbi:hypothetical protein OS175_13820 [Marinicella sp. S1101]|uniref:hypothetical protein n=1 Tax=Marinicella marina TaxID=2996016 RepID=UPI0022608EC7|nr:hypothetical protein [Marinicella marina]MCX7554950.1 hypothetical protein [Marinicella marina]MDJ1141560.1 hypothetical protein [Marinicella marina]